jgi:EpsI family protein
MASRAPSNTPPAEGGPALSRREFVVGGALGTTALLAAAAAPRSSAAVAGHPGASLEALLPKQIGQWTAAPFSDVLIPRAEKAEEKNYDEVVTRYYDSRSAPPIMLLVAYGKAQLGGTELHRPEACYPVAGFKLRRRPNVALRVPGLQIDARSMTAEASDRVEQLLYWTRVGADFPTSSVEQRWSAVRQSFGGSIPDGVLVRLSALAVQPAVGMDVLKRFAIELLGAGGPPLRSLLIGRG